MSILSGQFSLRKTKLELVKIPNPDFFSWAGSTPWGHVLSLKSWDIRYVNFQPTRTESRRSLTKNLTIFNIIHWVAGTRCQKDEKIVRQMNSKLLLNLTGWKTEYLIAQHRTGFQQKLIHNDFALQFQCLLCGHCDANGSYEVFW